MRGHISVAIAAATLTFGVLAAVPRAPMHAAVANPDFTTFWTASNPRDAAKAAERLLKDGVDFDTAWTQLKRGRTYGKAATGVRAERLRLRDFTFENTVEIPDGYDPARIWPVRVQLHGGINRPDPQESQDPPRRPRTGNRLALQEPVIDIRPIGWRDAQWWHTNQVENILTIVDRVKRSYNVDESRIYLTGVSDGGTGAYYFALREPTIWSVFLPLNGSLGVLANPAVGVDGELFIGNLVNRPLFIVNGGRDPLYPLVQVAPHIDLMTRAGVSMMFRPQPSAGHDTSWWPAERPLFEQFIRDHPRTPHRDRLSWETERTDQGNRIDWLVIESLGPAPSDVPLADMNEYQPRAVPDFGVRADRAIDAGTRLVEVRSGTDAHAMGLRKDDRIVRIDDVDVQNDAEIVSAMERHDGSRPIAIVVDRKGKRETFTGKFPPEPKVGQPQPMFEHRRSSGRVDVSRRGNAIEAKTRGVKTFRLLLSPDVIDFTAPVTVTVNGRAGFEGRVTKDPAVLLKWAARDNDRTMLFGAELKIQVP